MLNFTVGPVEMFEETKELGALSVPYFRTGEFSEKLLENERLFLRFAGAPADSRAVFLTASGTGAMEAAVVNTLTSQDRVLVVDGGSFGHRFVEICAVHNIPTEVILLKPGEQLTSDHLTPFEETGVTAFLINLDETSTGLLYDIDLVSAFCSRVGAFLVVDAVSAFLADPIDMEKNGIDVLITGSQKALAVPPGISLLALSPGAIERVRAARPRCFYFDLARALKDGERGQTPFTPAVGILLQINERLRAIEDNGGARAEIDRVASVACDFRSRIEGMPFDLLPETPANGVTALIVPEWVSAKRLFEIMKDEHGIWICPNGGELAERVFRVGHLGNLSPLENERLVEALRGTLAVLKRSRFGE